MQHEIVLKTLNFDLMTTRVWGGGGGGGGGRWGICGQNICYHDASFRDSNTFDMQHDHVLKKI